LVNRVEPQGIETSTRNQHSNQHPMKPDTVTQTPSAGAHVKVELEIQGMVDRETQAWDRQDAAALVELFHQDMVWPWPPDNQAHDPALWVFPQGRFDRERWKAGWEELFRTHELVHNHRRTVRVVVSKEGDAAFAVVDVDTLWRRRSDGASAHWKGRACKGYTKVGDRWLLIFHTGLLEYGI
jgi:ketosteroid isomerase-like protein